jgi:hypothetical protein
VAGKIIQDHDSTSLERWAKLRFDPGCEAGGVDRLIEDERCIDTVTSERRDKGHGFPMIIRHLGMKTLPYRRPTTAQCRHIGFGPSFINKNQACWINLLQVFLPPFPMRRDLWPQLLGGQNAFFEAEPLIMNQAPHLHIVDLYTVFGRETRGKPAKGEVAGAPCDQPIA